MGEAGDDGGRPQREFWALLSKDIRSAHFEGYNNRLVLRHDVVGLQVYVFWTPLVVRLFTLVFVLAEPEVVRHWPAHGHEFRPWWKWISFYGSTHIPLSV